jgi:hypothetical protein
MAAVHPNSSSILSECFNEEPEPNCMAGGWMYKMYIISGGQEGSIEIPDTRDVT